jgi:dethiobiotin synthase
MIKIFVTGTDTDVGKTFISALLCKRWNANYWKPIQTGLETDPGDTATVSRLIGIKFLQQPALTYQKPLSPWRAVVLEGREPIDLEQIKVPVFTDNEKPLIIEGAGGVYVPLTEKHITTDLIGSLKCPTIVVARSELGTLNHTLLTIEHLQNRHIPVLGVILNGNINEDNAEALRAFGVRILCQIPHADNLNDVVPLIPVLADVLETTEST